MPNIDIDAILLLIQQGFLIGAAIGVLVGSLTWSLVNPGLPPLFPLLIMGFVGLAAGAAIEGSAFLGMLNPSLVFMSSSGNAFTSFIAVTGWTIGGLAIGAALGNLSRALTGALLGVIMGTAAGVIMISFQDRIAFPIDHPISSLLMGIIVMLFVFLTSLGQGPNVR